MKTDRSTRFTKANRQKLSRFHSWYFCCEQRVENCTSGRLSFRRLMTSGVVCPCFSWNANHPQMLRSRLREKTPLKMTVWHVVCSDAGEISHANVDRYVKVFPADGELYRDGAVCRTCQLPKPARSKHCGKRSSQPCVGHTLCPTVLLL